VKRLNLRNAAALATSDQLTVPGAVSAESRTGIVHLGLGAFHRAHQAVYTEDAALDSGDLSWGICAATGRSPLVRDQLAPQDGLYGVLEKQTGRRDRLRINGIIREVVDGTAQLDHLLARLADADVAVVTLTVTEKGYRRGPDGRLNLADPAVRADLSGAAPPVTAVGRLARGLQQRFRTSGANLTVLSCDNLPHNGAVVRNLLSEFCDHLPTAEGDRLADSVERFVTFPNSMVDRIVPATTDRDRECAAQLTGLHDAGLVVAERFRQWVIEDNFAGRRPAWERAGAQLTDDIGPYELMKIRILNGSHSTLAYLGALSGHRTVAEAIADPLLADIVTWLIQVDMIPTIPPVDGVDLARYGRSVLERYANANLRHSTVQIAMDGTQKLPQRLIEPAEDAIRAGHRPHAITLGIAAWMAYVALHRSHRGTELPLDDPLSARLAQARGITDPTAVVDDLLQIRPVFGDELPEVDWWRTELVSDVRDLMAGHVPSLSGQSA
jgi:fructuronate reductase